MQHGIRPITPDDKDALVRFHARLSSDARYRRYHGAKGDLSGGDLRFLTEVDGVAHVAYVALDDAGEIDAVARIVAAPGGRHPELAVIVADDRRRLGLGRRVCEAAITAFGERSDPVVALVQPDNHGALRMFEALGATPRDRAAGRPVTLELPRREAA